MKRLSTLAALTAALAIGSASYGGRGTVIPRRTGAGNLTPEQLAEWNKTHATKKKAGAPNKRKAR